MPSSARGRQFACVPLIVAALILVPTLVRAQQHFDRLPIRTSIRLNWNGDGSRTRPEAVPQRPQRDLVAPITIVDNPHIRLVTNWVALVDEAAPSAVFISTPDTLRGPPAISLPRS